MSRRRRRATARIRRRPRRPWTVSNLVHNIGVPVASMLANSWSQTQVTRRRNGTDRSGVTNQYDVKTIYRKGRMSRGKKRAWKRFVRKSHAAAMKLTGTKSVVFNSSITRGWPNLENTDELSQDTSVFALYGLAGTNTVMCAAMNDIKRLTENDTQTDNWNERCIIGSATLDITFHNHGTNKLEVDVYTMYVRGDHGSSPCVDGGNNDAGTTPINGAGLPLLMFSNTAAATRGSTPFQHPGFLKLGYTVIKKVKHFVAPGEVFTHQIRDPRNRIIAHRTVSSANGDFCWSGVTKLLMFQVKAVAGSAGEDFNANLYTIGGTRTYSYKVFQDNQDKDQLFL